ncbi:MAG: hypothetical protein WC379_09760 [Methanoregula sp.]|jgi:hypothetical protein
MTAKPTTIPGFFKVHAIKISFCLALVIIVSSVMLVDRPCACMEIRFDGVAVERIHDNEISIVRTTDAGSSDWSTSRYPYHIRVNGYDVSDMETIRSQGLHDTVNPPEGLLNEKGSFVNLTGPDFMQNASGGVHLTIVEDFYHKTSMTVFDTTV